MAEVFERRKKMGMNKLLTLIAEAKTDDAAVAGGIKYPHINKIGIVRQQRPLTLLCVFEDARIVRARQPFVGNPPNVPTPVLKKSDGRLLDILVGKQLHQANTG